MQYRMFQVDVFGATAFSGNPAAVVLLEDDWLPDDVMQAVAAENQLSETAFVAPGASGVGGTSVGYGLRWFTPTTEVALCGHATLAAGYVVLKYVAPGAYMVSFATRQAGGLDVHWEDSRHLTVALPVQEPGGPVAPGVADAVAAALGATPSQVVEAPATIARFSTAEEVAALSPDFRAVGELATPWVVATAPGTGEYADHDWVCRYFAPGSGIDEDPVTGSAQTYLAPYWWPELTGDRFDGASVLQLSPRGGHMRVRWTLTSYGQLVRLTGHVVEYLDGTITVPLPGEPFVPPVEWDAQFDPGDA